MNMDPLTGWVMIEWYIYNVIFYDFENTKDKEEALKLINQTREKFENFLKDPVTQHPQRVLLLQQLQ